MKDKETEYTGHATAKGRAVWPVRKSEQHALAKFFFVLDASTFV